MRFLGSVPLDESTWRNGRGSASQLDCILVPERLKVSGYRVQPFWASDDCMVQVGVEVRGKVCGPGLWWLNTSYLQDPTFVVAFQLRYPGWQSLRALYNIQAAWWEDTKARVSKFCQWWEHVKVGESEEAVVEWS